MNYRNFSFFITFLLYAALHSFAQGISIGYSFVNYGVNQGLPSSEVYDIYQDPQKGILWIGTDRGLVTYDGYSFVTYTVNDGLTDNVIIKLTPDLFGNIWCQTSNNTLCYVDSYNHILPFKYNEELRNCTDGVSLKTISLNYDCNKNLSLTFQHCCSRITIDSTGTIRNSSPPQHGEYDLLHFINFFPKDQYYFYSLNPETKYHFQIKDLAFGTIHKIKDFFFLVTDEHKITICNGINTDTTIISPFQTIESGRVNDSTFWVSYATGGADFFDLKGNKKYHFLDNEIISDVIQDHDNGIWFSSISNGIFYLKNVSLKTINFNSDYRLSSISTLKNKIYTGYYNGDMGIINSETFEYKLYNKFKSFYPMLLQVNKDNDCIYFANARLCGQIDTNLTKPSLFKSGANKINDDNTESAALFSGYIGFLELINDSLVRYKTGYRATDIIILNRKIILSSYHGLYKYSDGNSKKIEAKELDYRIDDIDKYRNGLICASLGGGCVFYSPDTIFSIKRENGLLSNLSTEVFVENDSTVWLATTSGANKIVFNSKFQYTISSFTIADGLPSNEIIDFDMTAGYIWIATKKGLSFINKDYQLKISKSNLFFSIEKIIINGIKITPSPDKKLELTYDNNNVEVFFTAVSFSRNSSLTYRYILYPGNNEWTLTNNRSVIFPSLLPGNYQLKLEASVDNVNWSDPIALEIIITPPYWKTWWFIALLCFSFIACIYLVFRYRLNLQKRRINLLETEMKALRAQMNPHFIFHALASIQNFILKGNINDSNKYLIKFSRLIRGVLENSKTELVTLKKELEILNLYTELEQLRVKPFEFEIIIDKNINREILLIPPLLIQPFVENAIWHGFKSLERKGKITIEIKKDQNKLLCTIDDNGVGRQFAKMESDLLQGKNKSFGIAITDDRVQRLKKLYNLDTGIEITDKINSFGNSLGTRIVLILPIIEKS
jgi:hypothetical protein